MKSLQALYNRVLDNKVAKSTFLNESRRNFPNLFSNLQPYDEVVRVLVKKKFLSENLTKDYVSQHEFKLGYDVEIEKCHNPEEAEQIVLKNLTKDRAYYTNQISDEAIIKTNGGKIPDYLNESSNKNTLTKKTLVKLIKEELSKRKLSEGYNLTDVDDSFEPSMIDEYKNNQKDYEFYCVLGGKIVAGNEYKEDAIDFKNEYVHKPIKVYSKRFLLSKGIDPNNNKYWGNQHDLEEVKTNLFEEQEDPFQEEFKSPEEVSPEIQKLKTDIQTAIENNKAFKGLYDSAYSLAQQKDDTWRGLMDTLARKLYNYLATVKYYVDNVTNGDMTPIVNILTTTTSLNESYKLKLTDLLKK